MECAAHHYRSLEILLDFKGAFDSLGRFESDPPESEDFSVT